MIERIHTTLLKQRLRKFPVVILIGPRQCGKTTLARSLGGRYFDMETDSDATRLDAEWDSLAEGRDLVIIDEAHFAPEVFKRLRGTIDADRRRNGRYLLLGSVSPALMRNVAESLAGRMGMVRISPLILPEMGDSRMDRLWLRGGFPDGGILGEEMYPEWQDAYLETLAARDLPNWGLPAKPRETLRLMAMLGATHGQALNASQLGSSLSMDAKTVLRYCDFLEEVFLIRRLTPFYSNIRKRLVKTPRVYWRDSGLLHALMGVDSRESLFRKPWLGQSWEGFVIEQSIATLEAVGRRFDAHFFRTSDGYELDLVIEVQEQRWAVEIKLTSNPGTETLRRLSKTAAMAGATKSFMVCRIKEPIVGGSLEVLPLGPWLKRLAEPPKTN